MNLNQLKVLDYLREQRQYISPTQIGRVVGGRKPNGYFRHSSWASPICKKLVEMGKVTRDNRGRYRIANDAG